MAGPRVSIRLGTEGKAQVQQDFDDIATAGSARAQRLSAAFDKSSADVEKALERQAKAAQRLMAAGAINPTTGAGYDQSAKSAAASAAIFTKELERQETEAKRLIASIDPLFAAQMRYAQNVERINAVKATGQLTEEQYLKLLAAEETQLNQSAIASQRFAGASGSTRLGMQQLSFQIGDITQQLALGYIPLSRIFIQQSGQVIQAVQLMGGQTNKFTQFLGGPWGIALATASVAIVPLIAKLMETGAALDDEVEKLKQEAAQSALNDQAHKAFENTLEGVTEALKKNRDALKGMEDAGRTAAEQALRHASAEAVRLSEIRLTTQGLIAQAKAEIELNRARAQVAGMDPRVAGPVLSDADEAEQRLNALESTLPGLDAQMAEAQRQITQAFSHISVDNASRDAVEQIKRRYEGPDGLIEQARKRAIAEGKVGDELERQVKLLKDQEAEKIKAAQDKDKPHSASSIEHSGGDTVQRAQIEAFLDTALKYKGLSETRDKGVLEQFFREANLKLDPEKTAWCAAFVNAVLATNGVKGTGSLAARSFLGFGKDDMSSPQKGDLVVVSKNGQDHVGLLQNIDAKGNVSVFGGNTGNKVGTARYSASQVLGIRRPPTPGESYSADLKDAEDAAAEAVKAFIKSLAERAKIEIKEAGQPLEERGKALDQIDKLNGLHERNMAMLQAELGLVGESNSKREEALRLIQMEYDLRAQFPALTQAEIDKLVRQAAVEDQLRDHIAQVQQSVDDARQVGDQLIEDLFNPSNWESGRDLALAVLKDIEEALLRLAVINPLKNMLFGENNSTLGSIIGALFNVGGAAAGGAGGDAGGTGGSQGFIGPPNAVGDAYFPGGLTWVGEFGKELVNLPRGSRITPAAESRRLVAANDAGIGSISVTNYNDFRGADPAAVGAINARLDQMEAELPARVVSAYHDARSRGAIRTN